MESNSTALYSYLRCSEKRETYQCWSSYGTIGKVLRINQNTIRKYMCVLEEQQLIRTESIPVITKDDLKRNGNLLCTICLIQLVLDQVYEQQLAQMDAVVERQQVAKALALRSDKEHSAWQPVRRCAARLMNGR